MFFLWRLLFCEYCMLRVFSMLMDLFIASAYMGPNVLLTCPIGYKKNSYETFESQAYSSAY